MNAFLALGILLATLGAVTSGLGLVLMKSSSRLETHQPLHRRWRWIAGASLATFVNTGLDLVALSLTPLIIIAPIGSVTIVASVIFARLGIAGEAELVSKTQWKGIGGVVLGVVLVDVYGPHPDPELDVATVMRNFNNRGFFAYQITTLAVVAVLYYGLWSGRLGTYDLKTTLVSALAGGLCSGITMAMLKLMSTCIGAWTLNGTTPFNYFQFWFGLAMLVFVATMLLHILHVCLRSADVALATPLYQCSVILGTILAGASFYNEFSIATASERMVFVLGVAFVVGGLSVLLRHRRSGGDGDGLKLLPADIVPSEMVVVAEAAAEADL